MDFCEIKSQPNKRGNINVVPTFIAGSPKDIMFRGKSFYAIWNESKGLWSTNEADVINLIDGQLRATYDEESKKHQNDETTVTVSYLRDYSSGKWKEFCTYAKQAPDNYIPLDCKLTFSNSEVCREDYASKRLPYPLKKGKCPAWDELVGTLYEPEEREKIEWAIGSIVAGDAKDIQKFLVFYGDAGSGKSTILHIIEKLFEGYYTTFEAKALGSNNNAFATEVFRTNPLVAIQHDGDLSRIEDNSKLNSIISHEEMVLNEKYKSSYTSRVNCFLFMATNRPVKITDAKSGIIRRLIDVHPSNKKIERSRYDQLFHGNIKFELGAIAYHCLEVYRSLGANYYDSYRPLDMMYKTDVFYNFVEDSYDIFKKQNGVSLKQAWNLYKTYCDEALVTNKLVMYKFREELKNYFAEYTEFARIDGVQYRKYYSGFLSGKFENSVKNIVTVSTAIWLKFDREESVFDRIAADYKAQYATEDEKPIKAWDNVETKLSDLDTRQLHYVRVPANHIVIDFDIKDEHGAKSYEKNLEAAAKFPPTYAELSKSGAGIHLHYIYEGDVNELQSIFDKDIEVKVFKGKSSLRRKLTKCNSFEEISRISSGLPLKEKETKMIDNRSITSEKELRNKIIMALKKQVPPGKTVTCVSFIKQILDEAYANTDLTYDVSDMSQAVRDFANSSTNSAQRCLIMFLEMKFKSKDLERRYVISVVERKFAENAPRVFFDVETMKNLFLICWKYQGPNEPVHAMLNPSRTEVYNWLWNENGELRNRLVGFNNKGYDNAMVYGVAMGDSIEESYQRSQGIIAGDKSMIPRQSRDISETDIFDFASEKQGLKAWEIELKIPHKELPLKWDQEVPPDMIETVIEYCKNDVLATEALWDHLSEDFTARQMLAKAAGKSVNESTNSLTGDIVFGDNRNPQSEFNYRFMGDIPKDIYVLNTDTFEMTIEHNRTAEELIAEGKFSVFDMEMRPVFPGYTFNQYVKTHKSSYRGEDPKEGGYVYYEKGLHCNVALLDIASMHPSSIVAEKLFGERYTRRFNDILNLRLLIKHKKYDEARKLLDGEFAEYLQDESSAKRLSKVLKIPINAVYGQTAASFTNRFKDKRNIDNIVAKRGALFMINLKHEVQKRGFTVAHIKTDSIKIPNATPEIIDFVNRYGKVYGYNFEHEATYDRLCLINKADYIAKYKEPQIDKDGNKIWWTATGARFSHPYVFKRLFTHEPITFDDECETRSVTTAMYLDVNEDLPNTENLEKEYKKLQKKNPGFKDEQMEADIAKGHNYIFVGKTGSFCPVVDGAGGGWLVRENEDKFDNVNSSSGYRWMESEIVQKNKKEYLINLGYFESLADSAKNEIENLCDFTWFTSIDPVKTETINITSDELPF